MSASPNLPNAQSLVKSNAGFSVSLGRRSNSIPRKADANRSKGRKTSAVPEATKRRTLTSKNRKALLGNENQSQSLPFADLRKRVGPEVWLQWESKSRSRRAFEILCLLASYGFEGVIPHSLLVIETGLTRRQIARHLTTLQANGLLWRSPDYHRYAIRTELLVVAPRRTIGLQAALEYHRNRRRVRAATPLSYSPSLLRLERHPDNIPLATAQSAKADYETLHHRKPRRTSAHRYRFNHASLRDMLKALGITYRDGTTHFRMRCFSPECSHHRMPKLYLRHAEPKAGVWHCFLCDASGYVNGLVGIWTGWDSQKVAAFLHEHQAYEDPNDVLRPVPHQVAPLDLPKYIGRRHPYLLEERHLTNETLNRYDIGYDAQRSVVIIPIYDAHRALVAYKERWIDYRRYNEVTVTEAGSAFFGIDKIKPKSIVWLCEGEFDAMFVDQCLRDAFPHHGAIALSGKHLDERKFRALIALQPAMFVNALDNDKDGHEASMTIHERFKQIALVMRMQYEAFTVKDPNDSSPSQIIQEACRAEDYLYAGEDRRQSG